MPGERQGWNDWNRYKEAGLVDETVRFTDNEIETAHAIGKTKDTIGMCWPMDAAVAYTLASAGPDAQLSSKQMVNQHTKMAAAMMTQYVGWGTVPDPRVESCGHDEVDAYVIHWKEPVLNGSGHIGFHNSWRIGCSNSLFPTDDPLNTFRVSAQVAETLNTTKTAWRILMSPKYAPLRLKIEGELGTSNWAASTNNPFYTNHTKGECKWKDEVYPEGHERAGKSKKCAHHNKPKYTGWVMVKRVGDDGNLLVNKATGGAVYEQLWSRDRADASVYEGWNHDQISNTMGSNVKNTMAPARVVIWDKVKRNLGNQMTDKFVVKEINAACRRMTARNLNCVVKHGERSEETGRILPSTVTYTWKNWTWLAQLKAWIAQTSKKNRKEHDLVNGWKWTKYDSTHSYGFEIAKFKWTPGQVNDKFVLAEHEKEDGTYTTPPAISMEIKSYHLTVGGGWSSKKLPYRYQSKADAVQFRNFLSMMAGKCGGVNYEGRKWDGDKGTELVDAPLSFKIASVTHGLEMDMNKEPEDGIPTPTEMLTDLLFGTPQEYDAAILHLNEKSAEKYGRPKIIKETTEAVKVSATAQ